MKNSCGSRSNNKYSGSQQSPRKHPHRPPNLDHGRQAGGGQRQSGHGREDYRSCPGVVARQHGRDQPGTVDQGCDRVRKIGQQAHLSGDNVCTIIISCFLFCSMVNVGFCYRKAVLSVGIDEEDRKRTWLEDAEAVNTKHV